MWHAQRTVNPVAVTHLHLVVGWLAVLVMAPIAEVVRSKTVPKCDRATKLAFPVNFFPSMLFAIVHVCSKSFYLTVLANEVLFTGSFLHTEVSLAVNHASKVHLAALKALIKGT